MRTGITKHTKTEAVCFQFIPSIGNLIKRVFLGRLQLVLSNLFGLRRVDAFSEFCSRIFVPIQRSDKADLGVLPQGQRAAFVSEALIEAPRLATLGAYIEIQPFSCGSFCGLSGGFASLAVFSLNI